MPHVRAVARKVGASQKRLKPILDSVRGQRVEAAVTALRLLSSPWARTVEKVVRSAAANVENNMFMNRVALRIVRITADGATPLKRHRPRARGRIGRIIKRSSHITVVVDQDGEEGYGMGQKTHPYGFRLGIVKDWKAHWYAPNTAAYRTLVLEDLQVRESISSEYSAFSDAGISRVEIDRGAQDSVINIHSARPGILIGRDGERVKQLRAEAQTHPIEDVGARLRSMMPWIQKGKLVDKDVN